MRFHIGPPELIILLVIVMIVFGVGRLPEIGGALGRAIREFRHSQSGVSNAQQPYELDSSVKPADKMDER